MRSALVVIALLALVGCGESESVKLDRMGEQARAARAAEKPPMDPKGEWRVDPEGLTLARGGGAYLERQHDAMDYKDSLASDDPVRGSVVIKQDNSFRIDMTVGGNKIDLEGYIGLDKQIVEMFVRERDGKPVDSSVHKFLVLGEVDGDQMMLHLLAWRVWVPIARQ